MMANKMNLYLNQIKYCSIGIFSISCLFLSGHLIANEDNVLYTENGINVQKVPSWSPLGGGSVQYVRTRAQTTIQKKTAQHQGEVNRQVEQVVKPAKQLIKEESTETIAVKEPIKETFSIKELESRENAIDRLNTKPTIQTRKLHVRIEDDRYGAQALLEQLKLTNLEQKRQKKAEDLKLAPGKQVVDDSKKQSVKKIAKLKKINRRRHNPEDTVIKQLNFQGANILDVSKALSDISGLNFVSTEQAAKKNVTVFLQDISVINALETITKNSGLWYRKDKRSGVYRIMTTQEYARDLVVYREDITKIFRLLHPNPMQIANAIQDLYPNRVILSLGMFDDTFLQPIGQGGAARSTGIGRSNNSRGRGLGGGGLGGGGLGGGGLRGNQQGLNTTLDATKQDLASQVTSEQLSNLESRQGNLNANNSVSTEQLAGFTKGQQPIFVTLAREQDLMIVRTSDLAAMKDIESLVKALDLPTKQVLLEMKILSLDVGDFYRRATDLDFMPNAELRQGPLTDQPKNPLGTIAPINQSTTSTIGGTTITQDGVVNLGVSHILGLGNFALEGGTFVYQFLSDKIRARIQLLQQNNRINTLSSPILLTANKKPARVFVGVEQVVTTGFEAVTGTTNGLVATNPAIVPITEIRDIGNTLQVQPNINGDKTVTLLVQQDASTLVRGASAIPIPVGNTVQSFNVDSVRTSNIQGTVVAKDGLTIAIGGLIDATDSIEEQSVPFISEFPIIGELFKREVKEKSKRELILLITPHIIDTPNESDDISRDVVEPLTETEW